ncbi:MAG: RNA-binding cell elongation regulator Jag/EloR [Candidatus Promineifilaceae bacterium]
MIEERQSVEAHGANVEKAIQNGLDQLGLGREQVEISVLDEGSSGFLGLGGREAVVRLSRRAEAGPPPATQMREPTPPPAGEAHAAAQAETRPDEWAGEEPVAEEWLEEAEIATRIVQGLLEKLQIKATTTAHMTKPDDLTGERRLVVEIEGQDLGSLIGQRGDTLNAFQHVARVMAGHASQRRAGFILDVEGYRQRRERALARLAERTAEKALQRGRMVVLEPMPAHERRIIHLTLREHPQVFTESAGDGARRRVRVLLKR